MFVCLCVLDTRLSPYSKLLLTSPAQALNMLEEEKAVLQVQLSQEEDAQSCFIQSALCLLQVNCDRRLSRCLSRCLHPFNLFGGGAADLSLC